MKMNSGKYNRFVSGNKCEYMWAKVGDDTIWESRTVKLLSVIIDNKLKFDESYTISVLGRTGNLQC